VVNEATVSETGLEPTCHIAGSRYDFKEVILQLYHHPFGEEEIRLRKKILAGIFDNRTNGCKLINRIW